MMQLPTSVTAAALSAVHLVLAAGVTSHALATKRDPASAVGWIGLAWLSPIIGSVLYLMLGINRVRRRALSMRGAAVTVEAPDDRRSGGRFDYLAPLTRAGSRITGRPIEGDNAVAILHNGDMAYPLMLAAIDTAQSSVGLQSYIFRGDTVGEEFIGALIRAHGRGVEVRVLIDGYGGGYFRSVTYHRLRRAGVPVARFLHSALPWRMPFLNLRSHRKILTIDGCASFTGGLNIGAENVLAQRPTYPVVDTHFRVEGPVVAQVARAFAEQWNFTTRERLAGVRWFPPPTLAGDCAARAVTSGPDQDLEKIELLILEAVGCARESIKVMTPYFLPDERLITALALAAMRGVGVDIVLPRSSNHPSIDWATRAHVGPLLEAGCRLWLRAPPFNHSKLMVVDDTWCFIGSANWDARSFRLNFEINLELYSRPLAAELGGLITPCPGSLLTLADLAARSLARRGRDGAARLLLPYL